MGQKLYQIFLEFQEAGFAEVQAFELTKAILFAYPFLGNEQPEEDKKSEELMDNISYLRRQLSNNYYNPYVGGYYGWLRDSVCTTTSQMNQPYLYQ